VPAAALPAGSVLQVKSMTTSTQVTNSTATFASSGLTLAITPTSATSKILIQVYGYCNYYTTNYMYVGFRLNKNSGTILTTNVALSSVNSAVNLAVPVSTIYLDSPATTSSTTYTFEFNFTAGVGVGVYPTMNPTVSSILNVGSITLMEIAA
jgi:hypothetical protein